MRIVFIGPPGVGKGTQSERLSEYLRILHLSTGEMLRQAYHEQSDLGLLAQEHIAQGRLVPDAVMTDLVAQRLELGDCRRGYILDGFPRTLGQAETLDNLLRLRGTPLTAVLALDANTDELVRRLVRNRLEEYSRQTAPLVDYYRGQGLLQMIVGMGTPEEVFARIKDIVDQIAHTDA